MPVVANEMSIHGNIRIIPTQMTNKNNFFINIIEHQFFHLQEFA